jgi:ABC-2 type transport system permease protein
MSETTLSADTEAKDTDSSDEEGAASSRPPAKPAATNNAAYERSGSAAKNVWTILKREMASYFNSPLAYILICVSLIGLGAYFFWYEGGVWQADRASMSRLLAFMPRVLCILTVPLFTMRSLSEEKRLGTMELLITMPVKDSEVILGKYFAALAIVSVQLLLLVAYPAVMFFFPFKMGDFDWNTFWSGIAGLFLLASAGVAVGIMFSSFTESQILAFFATAVTLVLTYEVGLLSQTTKGLAGDIISFLSFQTRYEPFARGLIDTRAVVYFLSFAVVCTLVAFRNLEGRKWR